MNREKNNKHILLMLPYGSVGGMERLALTFYNYYKSLGFEVKAVKFIKLDSDIINFGKDELYLSLKDFNNMSVLGKYSFYLKAPFALKKIIKKYKITHSIAFGDMANLFSSLTFTNEYKIGSIHSFKSIELSSSSTFNKLTKLGYRSSYKYLHKLVCISKTVQKDLIANCNYKFKNTQVIYNPHNTDLIRIKGDENLFSVQEQKLYDREVILFLGRLSLAKAPWHLISAFKSLHQKRSNAILVFVGDGEESVTRYVKTLVKYFNLEDKVFFLGRKNNPYPYLKRASCIALTSNFEGTPNVIVEAIALNVPVVTSFCTLGILELMSIDENLYYNNKEIIRTEAGFITPNFYEGTLNIPKTFEKNPTKKEELFAQGLEKVLDEAKNGTAMVSKQSELLQKFDLPTIAKQYLTETF